MIRIDDSRTEWSLRPQQGLKDYGFRPQYDLSFSMPFGVMS
jgi:hypothetical protein